MIYDELNKKLVEIFGLENKKITKMNISINTQNSPTITTTELIEDKKFNNFCEIIKDYRLTRLPSLNPFRHFRVQNNEKTLLGTCISYYDHFEILWDDGTAEITIDLSCKGIKKIQ